MKKFLSVTATLVLVIVMLCSTGLSAFASVSVLSSRGLIDNTAYYIYSSAGSESCFLHSPNDIVYNREDAAVSSIDVRWDDSVWLENRFIWTIHKQSDGTFILESVCDKYLRVTPEEDIIIHYNIGDDSLKFEICRVDTGDFEGTYTIKNGDYYIACNGEDLFLSETKTDYSYWTFMAANRGTFSYYGYIDDDFDTTRIGLDESSGQERIYIGELFATCGYDTNISITPVSSETVLNNMINNDITILTGQGSASTVITNPNGTSNSMVMADYEMTSGYIQQYISDLGFNDLAKSRCIIYASSYSGNDAIGNDGEEYNLVDATYNSGAHFVVGFKVALPSNLINNWISYFVSGIFSNYSIESAVIFACEQTGLYNIVNGEMVFDNFIYFRGDGRQYLNFGWKF